VWGSAYNTTLHRLIILQKRAIRTIDNCHYCSHTEPLFKQLNILKLKNIYIFSCCMFMYKFKNKILPNVCECLLMLNMNYNSAYCLRNVSDFTSPLHRTNVIEKYIKVCGPKFGNTVSNDIKILPTELSFKLNLRYSLIVKYSATD